MLYSGKTPDKLPESGRLQLIEMSVTESQGVGPSQEGSVVNVEHNEENSSKESLSKENDGKEEQLKL